MSEELLGDLRAVVPPQQVISSPLERIALASDASFYRLVPQAIVRPASIEEVRGLFEIGRRRGVPMTFRAAGTSLSGQAITDGVLIDISRHWRHLAVEQGGATVRVQPGVIGGTVNRVLARFGRRLGPDPASINACMMGGILANNSSGMCCGVRDNAYHTMASMTLVLADGGVWDSARDDDAFAATALGTAITVLRDEVRADPALVERIRRKYAIKNTTGYGLNAFLDHDAPLQILARLMIGSEGTLGFIAEAVLRTVPDPPLRLTGLFVFGSVTEACDALPTLSAAGAAALELMDRASLAAVVDQPGIPAAVRGLPPGATALLVEFQATDAEALAMFGDALRQAGAGMALLTPPLMAEDAESREALWRIRKGLYPSVGATRESGTTVIIEDFAVPPGHLGPAVEDLQTLFARHGYRGIVFGHARDGNLHFVITQSFNDDVAVSQYAAFMEDVVEMVTRHGGSLKAEHGTGRNMAPFVEREWGTAATTVMRTLKRILDPVGFLNPGVIVTDDARAHLRHLKDCPKVDPRVDRCIECGFCEPHCPSRDLTMTPRQRIVALREVARGTALGAAVWDTFAYPGIETCAADGMCATACPVSIDTGTMMKALRTHSPLQHEVSRLVARRYVWVERLGRGALRIGHGLRRWLGVAFINALIGVARKGSGAALPYWRDPMPRPAGRLPSSVRVAVAGAPQYLYFPSCISRIMGPDRAGEAAVPALLTRLAQRAGVGLECIDDAPGLCCGMPFASKGYLHAAEDALTRVLGRLSGDSRTVVVDNSSCSLHLYERCSEKGIRILDSVAFAHDVLLPRLRLSARDETVAVHPVCAVVKLGLGPKLLAVARAAAVRAEIPPGAGCCGTAGDRGLMYPELTAAATRAEKSALDDGAYSRFCASNRTCEMGLSQATGRSFGSFLQLLADAAGC